MRNQKSSGRMTEKDEEQIIEAAKHRCIQTSYQMQAEVGRGSFGIVHKVHKKHTRREYACKTLKKNDKTPDYMLQREIESLRNLHHPHILKLVDIFEESRFVHIVSELCTGGELYERVGTGHWKVTEKESAKLLQNILSAIAYLHENGVVHRDLKASNFLFATKSTNTNVKVIDFGLARKLSLTESAEGTMDYQRLTTKVGTPYYVAPEVLLQDSYDSKCDVWSVGIIAYLVLSRGKLPYCGEDEKQTIALLKDPELHCDYEPAEIWAELDESAKDFCQALMEKDPVTRPTAKEAMELPWIQAKAGTWRPRNRRKTLTPNTRNAMENFFGYERNKQPRSPRGPTGETEDADANERYIENARHCNIESSYAIQMEVGRGSFGIVRKARKKHSFRDFACKTIRKNDKSPIQMLQREVEALQTLQDHHHHKNIIELQEVFEEPHFVHIVTELCRGEELYERIGSGDWNPTEPESAKLLRNILSAICHMHEHGVVHRDLKASNFMFVSKNTNTNVKIIGFDLARKLPLKEGPVDSPEYEDQVLTTKVGTPYYVAPEVLLQDSYNCKCDVWSVGVIAYLVLSGGKLPFCGEDEKQTIELLKEPELHCDYDAEVWGELDESAKDFCQALLQRDPALRPTAQDALDLDWVVTMPRKLRQKQKSRDEMLESFFRTITLSRSSTSSSSLG
mmetsp:Transcript_45242/g.109490  ORF Transcript_45242/g.109490 Transcript_45242/m.109490 type:complete len:681 (-) Transcript_45242:60-2102(-)